jgi:hypothetical protein
LPLKMLAQPDKASRAIAATKVFFIYHSLLLKERA